MYLCESGKVINLICSRHSQEKGAAFVYTSGILLKKAVIHINEAESFCSLRQFYKLYLMILFVVDSF